jgi:tRNA-splicing ligase RtcB
MTPTIIGEHAENTLEQLADVARTAERVALMADGHLGYIMPVGGVAAYDNQVAVHGVGYDIACGNAAIETNLIEFDHLDDLADEIQRTISFGIGRTNRADDAPMDDPLFASDAWSLIPATHREPLRQKARAQLGTVGSGNHYVDVFRSLRTDRVWVGVHFGSRGLGHTIASGFLSLASGGDWGKRVPEAPALLPLDSQLGQDYWALMELAGAYAYAGREWVARKVVGLLSAKETRLVHNHHNFAWKEQHGGRELVVVRKGATPAFPDQEGFVGGSMGDVSVILKGTGQGNAPDLLYSTVHGAGRVMSRTQAAGKRNRKTGETIRPGLVSQAMMECWLEGMGVILRGGGLDESPHAYRRLPDVLEAQGESIEVTDELYPLVVVMAGAREFDPYKD